jgi:hypothetical protein
MPPQSDFWWAHVNYRFTDAVINFIVLFLLKYFYVSKCCMMTCGFPFKILYDWLVQLTTFLNNYDVFLFSLIYPNNYYFLRSQCKIFMYMMMYIKVSIIPISHSFVHILKWMGYDVIIDLIVMMTNQISLQSSLTPVFT